MHWSWAPPTAFQSVTCIHAEWEILCGRVRNAGLSVISGNTLINVAYEYCRRAPSDFVCHTGLAIRQPPCSRHRNESATKTIKFFVAHTGNYVLCNNHTWFDRVLLNFTPVIQQNYHQPGRKFEKLFCAVDRFSSRGWAVNLSVKIRNQPIQKQSCFWYRKLCAFNLLSWGLNVVLRYLTSSDFCVA